MRKSSKKYRIKSKFRFIAFIVVVLGIAAGTLGYLTGYDVSIALENPGDQITVEVSAGDTVERYCREETGRKLGSDRGRPERPLHPGTFL